MAKKNPPKIGEIRIGRAGNKYNKWDGKRWVPVSAARTAGAQGRKPSVASKPISASTTSTRAKNAYSAAAVPLTTRQSNRSQLPTSSMTPLSYAKRLQGLRRSLQAAETRARITTGTAATRAKNKAEVERLKKEIATLSKKK